MEVKDLKDFYIDLDGDIKASAGDAKTAVFITNSDKPSSQYVMAENIDQIKSAIKQINSDYDLDFEIYKQYSVKCDKDGNVVSIKIWSDSNNRINDLDTVLVGHEISYDNVVRDYYFTGSIESVNTLIQSSDLNYEIKEFDTHKHFLYSIKYDISNNILNFKTYYILNEHAMYYTNEMIPHLKKILTFN
jgi:exo-beta-1,3-glucanase (GH17 family)